MASEDVVIRYRAEVDEATRKLELFAKENKDLTTSSTEASKAIDKEAKSVDKLEKELTDTGKKLSSASKQTAGFGKTVNSTFSSIGAGVKSFAVGAAATLGAAFSIQAIVSFSKASIDAFLDAEKNAERLKFAITTIGGESEAIFDILIKQSERLQKVTIFSDDSIQQAQAALSAFGLTGVEIEKLIPKLADFATVAGVDIVQAAQQIGAGLEGAGREFKKYGIEVSATASRQENLNSILEGFGKVAGAAEDATKTLSGELQVLTNRADDIQETIGKKLAPAFVKAKLAVFEAGLAFLNFLGIVDSTKEKLESDTADSLGASYSELAKRLKEAGKSIEQEFGASIQKSGEQIDQVKNKNEELTKSIEDRIAAISRSTSTINPADDQQIKALIKQRDENENLIELLNARVKAMNEVIEMEKSLALAAASSEVDEAAAAKLLAERLKQEKLLRDLQIKNISDDRIRRLAEFQNDVASIEATGKLRDAIIKELQITLDRDLSELDKKQTEAEVDEYDKRDKARLERDKNELEAAKKKSEELIQLSKDAAQVTLDAEIESLQGAPRSERIEKAQFEERVIIANSLDQIAQLQQDYENGKIETLEERTNRQIIIEGETADKIKSIYASLGLSFEESAKSGAQVWFDKNAEILATSQQLLGELTNLYAAYADAQIKDIQRTLEAQIKAIDEQLIANDDALGKRRISEEKALENEKLLIEKKTEAQENAAKQERAIKRKQAELDKAAALVNIAISTAQNIASTPIPALWALYAALGAAQIAVVAAQPIPYKKGTKSAKGGLSLVGEEGPELMMATSGSKILPAGKTKQNADIIDAMFDNRLDKYILDRYINPALVAQKRQHEKQAGESFAQNITKSMIYNSAGVMPQDLETIRKRGQIIANVDEMAEAFANKIKIDPYRR